MSKTNKNEMNVEFVVVNGDHFIKLSDVLCYITNRKLFLKRNVADNVIKDAICEMLDCLSADFETLRKENI